MEVEEVKKQERRRETETETETAKEREKGRDRDRDRQREIKRERKRGGWGVRYKADIYLVVRPVTRSLTAFSQSPRVSSILYSDSRSFGPKRRTETVIIDTVDPTLLSVLTRNFLLCLMVTYKKVSMMNVSLQLLRVVLMF